ncbi:hypothetical protein [Solicola sp. PLA-1-18]|uniref:hypothetical protein n=1 Tax=Solicola sp. PLA-1-18 TaxID=3380532 RepID=UPI003B8155DD
MRRLLLVVLTVAVTVGLAGAPASAQTKVRKDKVGEVAADIDVRSAKVQNNRAAYALTLRFVKVRRGHTALAAFISPAGEPEAVYVLQVLPTSRGRYSPTLERLDLDGDSGLQKVGCPGAAARGKAGRRGYVRVVVPQSCFGADAGTLVTSAFSFDGSEGGILSGKRGDEPYQDDADGLSDITTRRG